MQITSMNMMEVNKVKQCSVHIKRYRLKPKIFGLHVKKTKVTSNICNIKVKRVEIGNIDKKAKMYLEEETVNEQDNSQVIRMIHGKTLVAKPKSIKQRLLNRNIMEDYNKDHEDNWFTGKVGMKWNNLLETSQDSQDTSLAEERDQEEAVGSRSPFPLRSLQQCTSTSEPQTPKVLRQRSRSPQLRTRWQHEGFLHRTLQERKKLGRKRKVNQCFEAVVNKRDNTSSFSNLSNVVKATTTSQLEDELDLSGAESYFSDN